MHTCGFDSIPSDLGVHALHLHARDNDLGDLRDTTLVVTATRGGVSGGTVDSLRGQLDIARRDPAARQVMSDPYALSPDRAGGAAPRARARSDDGRPRRRRSAATWRRS